MKFFTKYFNSIKHRSSINFFNNIFFLKNMLSINVNHTLIPHFFLPNKTLKIKYLNSNVNLFVYINLLVILCFIFSIIYFLI